MATNTTNYNLVKPNKEDFYDVEVNNSNMDTLDGLLFDLSKDKVDKITGKGLSANDFTTTLKNKLDGIEAGANKYEHPATHAPSIIKQDANNRFVTDTEKTKWNKVENKVDKITGKGLSENDYTDLEKLEVAKIKDLATLHELALLEDEVRTHKADYTYQIPNIVGTQIRINRLSDTDRLYFRIDNDLAGNITISLDNGVTEKPLNDFEGVQLTELEKGFVEVVADATFFILRSRSGLSKSDKLALIGIVNVAETNETFIKTDIVNKINEVDSGDKFEPLVPASPWVDIQSAIPLISTGKKWASGTTMSYNYQATQAISVRGLGFTPKLVFAYDTTNDNYFGYLNDYAISENTKSIYKAGSTLINVAFSKNNELLVDGFDMFIFNSGRIADCFWIAFE